jgi:hypothetical protein
MGDKMSRKELQAAIQDAVSTPATRARDWIILQLAKVGVVLVLIWVLTHLDGIVDWWNGK